MRSKLTDLIWPGRRVRPVSTPPSEPVRKAPAAQAPDGDTPTIVPREHHAPVRAALQRAEQASDDLARTAYEALDRELSIDTSRLPLTRDAVRMLSGSHPQFGTVLPEVPDEDKISGDHVGAKVYDRAYSVMEHADRAVLGFDATDIVSPDFNGTVRPYGPITRPREASGEVDPPRTGEDLSIDETIEGRLSVQKRDIMYLMFVNVISFILRFVGDIIRQLATTIENVLSIKIFGKRIAVGKPIAKPFHWLADLFHKWADKMEALAAGLGLDEPMVNPGGDPDTPPEDPNTGDYETPGEDGEEVTESFDLGALSNPAADIAVRLPRVNSARAAGSSGLGFLMAAHRVLATTSSHASRAGADSLRDALMAHEQARRSRRNVEALKNMASAWGIDVDAPVEATPGAVAPTVTTDPEAGFTIDC